MSEQSSASPANPPLRWEVEGPRIPWPDGLRCPTMLCFHVDGESVTIVFDRDNVHRPMTQTMYTYGPRLGLQRVLRLLRHYDVRASFYIPAETAMRHPYAIEWIQSAGGHEIGCHGLTHDFPDRLEPEAEIEQLDKQIEILTSMTGVKPRGYISPSWEYSSQTLSLVMDRGFEYSSDWQGEDVPFYVEVDGRQTDFVAMPVSWVLDDSPLWHYAWNPQINNGAPYAEPEKVHALWTSEFDALWEEGGVCQLSLHPFLMRSSRVKVLERFIRHVLDKGDAGFFTIGEVVDMYKAVVTPEQGRPGAWHPARGDAGPKARQVGGVPIFT